MKGKIFTVDEVNRMLPLVSRIASDIVGAYTTVHQALSVFEDLKERAETDETLELPLRRADEDVAGSLDAFQALIEEVEALGGTVKDYEQGAIDFYGEVEGEIVYLCWNPGETEIGYWHALEEGFGKRRPLPQTAAA